MIKWIGVPLVFLLLSSPVRAQQLNGVWQGVEVNPPKTGFWPTVLTLAKSRSTAMLGVLYQEGGNNPDFTATFQVRGAWSGGMLQLSHTSLLRETVPDGMGWCQGTILFTYDAAEEKLSGQAVYEADNDCNRGIFTLYRILLKSAATVPAATATTLRVSGQQVRWYADAAHTQLLATGNTYPTRLTKTTTFYLTQGFYPTRIPTITRITVQVAAAAVSKTVAKASAKPAPAATKAAAPTKPAPPPPIALPTVLFQTATALLLPASAPALDALAATLQTHPTVRLRISGHTDQIGADDKNQLLSEQRAAAVRQYLVQKGIAATRLETVGYGHTRLLYPAPDVRNRRVEIQELK